MNYGYCRISRPTQNIERQVRNILASYPDAILKQEAYTGWKMKGRKEWEKLLDLVRPGDTIIFDSVSRMSRNAEEGVTVYFDLMDKGINLVFLKEPYVNTDVYRTSVSRQIDISCMTGNQATDNFLNKMQEALNGLTRDLAKEQIILAFQQSQKEVDDLRLRTSEGMETARRLGKRIGNEKGQKLKVKKAEKIKMQIIKYSKDFEGTLNDKEVMAIVKVARNTYYKYKNECKETA